MTKKERILAELRKRPREEGIAGIQQKLVERLIESDFTLDLIGTEVDERGSLFMYCFSKTAILAEDFSCDPSCVLVSRIFGFTSVLRAYMLSELERIAKISEDEKELVLDRLVHTLTAGENEDIGQGIQE